MLCFKLIEKNIQKYTEHLIFTKQRASWGVHAAVAVRMQLTASETNHLRCCSLFNDQNTYCTSQMFGAGAVWCSVSSVRASKFWVARLVAVAILTALQPPFAPPSDRLKLHAGDRSLCSALEILWELESHSNQKPVAGGELVHVSLRAAQQGYRAEQGLHFPAVDQKRWNLPIRWSCWRIITPV